MLALFVKRAARCLRAPPFRLAVLIRRGLSTNKLPVLRSLALREAAFTHGSVGAMVSISAGKDFNRLEYLGDSVLGMISAELLFAVEPSLDAGAMTKLRSHLVCRDQLVKFADQFDLISELKHNLTNNNDYESNLLADSFEAYIGAYYLDAGIGPVREFMQPLFKAALVSAQDEVDVADAKGKLQELLEPTGEKPEYRFSRSGADHQPTFEAEVWFFGECRGKGVSSSKKAAEKLAAHAALVTYKANFFENLMKAEPI